MAYTESNALTRAYWREQKRGQRMAAKAAKQRAEDTEPYTPPELLEDKIASLVDWSRSLQCPPGHPRAGQSMELPPYLVSFMEGALSHREAALCVARKNAKTQGCAMLALWEMLHYPAWRGAVVSLNLDKGREFLRLAEGLIRKNSLPLKCYQKRIINRNNNADLEVLPATSDAGAASGYDAIFLDELGLYPPKCRALVRGMYSSITARDGKVRILSIRGDNEILEEVLARADNPDTYVQLHAAAEGAGILDEDAWHTANPGLAHEIKSLDALRFAANNAVSSPADIAWFKSHELNQRLRPDAGVLVVYEDWVSKVETTDPPAAEGPCFLGLDLGSVSSMTGAAAYYPESGLLQCWGCFPEVPGLDQRCLTDGVGTLYFDLVNEGSLRCYGDRIPDYHLFLEWVFSEIETEVLGIAYDRFRKPEVESILDTLGIHCPRFPRGTGAAAKADGSHDVRQFQRLVLSGQVKSMPLLIWRAALRYAVLRVDPAGNPALEKSTRKGRIDVVSAATLALGLSALNPVQEYREPRFVMI